jgi:hypothetical protein
MTATPKLLRIYLNDHLAGSGGGLRLATRARDSNARTKLGAFLGRLVKEIEEDRAALLSIMERLGVKPDPLKEMVVRLAELAGRAKLNGRLTTYSPLSRLQELELLCLGVEGKASLWRSLREVQPKLAALADTDFDALIARAESQRAELEDFRLRAAARALLSD